MQLRKTEQEISNLQSTEKNIDANTALTATRGLIAKHGEEIASIAADIARVVRSLIGNKTPEEIARIIQEQITKASGYLTDAMERAGTGAKNISSTLSDLNSDISIYINDTIENWMAPRRATTSSIGQSQISLKEQYRRETKGRDISYKNWLSNRKKK